LDERVDGQAAVLEARAGEAHSLEVRALLVGHNVMLSGRGAPDRRAGCPSSGGGFNPMATLISSSRRSSIADSSRARASRPSTVSPRWLKPAGDSFPILRFM